MRSISLPGLVLWLPLGSPAACLEHTQPVALNRRTKKHPPDSLSLAFLDSSHQAIPHGLRTSQSAPHCAHIADAVAYKGPSWSPALPPFSFPIPSPTPADIPPLLLSNAPASGIRGPQVTPPPPHLVLLWQVHRFFITSAPFYYTATLHLIPTQE